MSTDFSHDKIRRAVYRGAAALRALNMSTGLRPVAAVKCVPVLVSAVVAFAVMAFTPAITTEPGSVYSAVFCCAEDGGGGADGGDNGGRYADDTLSGRMVEADRIFNFRDLGGYATAGGGFVRRNMIFRSGELAFATDGDIKRLSDVFKIRTIVDFRYPEDCSACPDREVSGAESFNIPVRRTPPGASARAAERFEAFSQLQKSDFALAVAKNQTPVKSSYTYDLVMSEAGQAGYAEYFKRLKESDGAVLFHCIAGKDRTGVAAFMTLVVLGVPEKAAMDDYEETKRYYDMLGAGNPGVRREDLEYAVSAMLEKYGSYEAFFRDAYGLTEEDIKGLRSKYTVGFAEELRSFTCAVVEHMLADAAA